VTGTNQRLGDVTGAGALIVAHGADLTAGNLLGQTSIAIEGTATVGNIDGVAQGDTPTGCNVGAITVGLFRANGHLTANRITPTASRSAWRAMCMTLAPD